MFIDGFSFKYTFEHLLFELKVYFGMLTLVFEKKKQSFYIASSS